ncbi:MAG: RHS repeat protein [Gemmatimonadetes bacterium]|nr:RHS repeat protein [Gemmatimonadota bacterium]
MTDPRGVKRHYRYDARGLTVGEVDDASQTKRAFYSVGGLLDSLRMRNGLTTRFRYDAFGRRTAMIYPEACSSCRSGRRRRLSGRSPDAAFGSTPFPMTA